jgi:hypothetical protein
VVELPESPASDTAAALENAAKSSSIRQPPIGSPAPRQNR